MITRMNSANHNFYLLIILSWFLFPQVSFHLTDDLWNKKARDISYGLEELFGNSMSFFSFFFYAVTKEIFQGIQDLSFPNRTSFLSLTVGAVGKRVPGENCLLTSHRFLLLWAVRSRTSLLTPRRIQNWELLSVVRRWNFLTYRSNQHSRQLHTPLTPPIIGENRSLQRR